MPDQIVLGKKLRELLDAVAAGRVEFAPSGGRHQWWLHRDGAPQRVTTHLTTLVLMELVQRAKPRASGTARLTDQGRIYVETNRAQEG